MAFDNGNNMDYFYGMREDEDRSNRESFEEMRADRNGSRMCRGMIHIVSEGDTLYKIAQMYHVDVSEVMYENPYVNIYQLQPGDEICVPVLERADIMKIL